MSEWPGQVRAFVIRPLYIHCKVYIYIFRFIYYTHSPPPCFVCLLHNCAHTERESCMRGTCFRDRRDLSLGQQIHRAKIERMRAYSAHTDSRQMDRYCIHEERFFVVCWALLLLVWSGWWRPTIVSRSTINSAGRSGRAGGVGGRWTVHTMLDSRARLMAMYEAEWPRENQRILARPHLTLFFRATIMSDDAILCSSKSR